LQALCDVMECVCFVSAKMASLDIFGLYFDFVVVFINMMTNLLIKITLHSHACDDCHCNLRFYLRSWIQDPSRILDPRCWIQDPRSWIQDPRSWLLDPASRIFDPGSLILGSRILDPGSWIQDPESPVAIVSRKL
jgi:hypothetical protein